MLRAENYIILRTKAALIFLFRLKNYRICAALPPYRGVSCHLSSRNEAICSILRTAAPRKLGAEPVLCQEAKGRDSPNSRDRTERPGLSRRRKSLQSAEEVLQGPDPADPVRGLLLPAPPLDSKAASRRLDQRAGQAQGRRRLLHRLRAVQIRLRKII